MAKLALGLLAAALLVAAVSVEGITAADIRKAIKNGMLASSSASSSDAKVGGADLNVVPTTCLASMPTVPSAVAGYLQITGQRSGPMNGGSTLKGREKQIEVLMWSQGISMPIDPASSLPTGKRHHTTLKIVKPIDKATPMLINALVTNENLSVFKLKLWAPSLMGSPMGTEVNFYTIELTDARVSSYNVINAQSSQIQEEVTFSFVRIMYTWNDGGIMATDDLNINP